MKSERAHHRVRITMLSLILARRVSSYVESISMVKIPEWMIFVFISIGPGKLAVQKGLWILAPCGQMSDCKKSARGGIWTSKESKQPSMKSLFTIKPQDPTIWALNGCPLRVFFAFAWVKPHTSHLRLEPKEVHSVCLMNIHWKSRGKVCRKSHKDLFVFPNKCLTRALSRRRWLKDHKQRHQKWTQSLKRYN